MNISYAVSGPDSIPVTTARIRAVGAELRGLTTELLKHALEEGQRVAIREAPRAALFQGHEGQRISNSIHVSTIVYRPGGAGGGGFYEASLHADGDEAPHLLWVFQGTGERGIEPTGKIGPAHGNVMEIQKEGEEVRFRTFQRGQHPQQRWWEEARLRVEEVLETGVREIEI